jgi:peptidoglycan/LPS O-acetylase OafA/YrhL
MNSMKFRYLDGLRGLAALIVVIDHFAISFFPAATDGNVHVMHGALESFVQRTPLHVLVSGNFSVCIFFVLSGVVLSTKFFSTGDKQVVIASASKRYTRLMIPVLASVLLSLFLLLTNAYYNVQAAAQSGSQWLGSFWQFQPSVRNAIYHATIGVFIHGNSSYNTVLWTMKTELFGSFLVFLLLLAVGKWRYRAITYIALGVLLMKTYYITFILGVALCDYYHHGGALLANLMRRWWLPLGLFSLYLGSCPVGTLKGTLFQYASGWVPAGMSLPIFVHILGAIGLVTAVLYAPILQRLLTRKPALYLGKISFSLYLTHFLILGSLGSYLFAHFAPAVGYRMGFLLMIIPVGLVIWLVAHVFTALIDEPAIRLSGRLYTSYFRNWLQSFRLKTLGARA